MIMTLAQLANEYMSLSTINVKISKIFILLEIREERGLIFQAMIQLLKVF